ncbi:MAG: hypothetical protein DHS80DRAFT_21365 [Piptocephalis tieghemiana]|nr:MAG: hypothetical protein DHS80DRAFT_21365 [Piptocephalis tieghemiana]
MESPPGREDTTKLRDVHGRELDLARRIDLSSPIEPLDPQEWEEGPGLPFTQVDPHAIDIVRLGESRAKALGEIIESRDAQIAELIREIDVLRAGSMEVDTMEQEEEDVMDETKDKGPVISEKLEEQVKYLQDRVQHLERKLGDAEEERDRAILRVNEEGKEKSRDTPSSVPFSLTTEDLQEELKTTQRERDKLVASLEKFERKLHEMERALGGIREERDNLRGLYEQAHTELRQLSAHSSTSSPSPGPMTDTGVEGSNLGEEASIQGFHPRGEWPSSRSMGRALSKAQARIRALEHRLIETERRMMDTGQDQRYREAREEIASLREQVDFYRKGHRMAVEAERRYGQVQEELTALHLKVQGLERAGIQRDPSIARSGERPSKITLRSTSRLWAILAYPLKGTNQPVGLGLANEAGAPRKGCVASRDNSARRHLRLSALLGDDQGRARGRKA